MVTKELLLRLKDLENPENVAGMARFGINPKNTLGISVTSLRSIAKEVKREEKDNNNLHKIALELWESQIHEARMLSILLDVPELVTEKQADNWVKQIESWDIGDGFCMNLIDKTSFAFQKAKQWVGVEEEFVRRAGFATMAALSVHDKKAEDKSFEEFFPLIKKYSTDERNFVRKAVNWALRQIGKRNNSLLSKAIKIAEKIEKIDSKSARWIARDALKELRNRDG